MTSTPKMPMRMDAPGAEPEPLTVHELTHWTRSGLAPEHTGPGTPTMTDDREQVTCPMCRGAVASAEPWAAL